ncbi:hypothetical protein AB0J82_13925 [Asanoa sp. NPDC049518]|uniref:hypothetical protein n=1 Tax=unclassified Asanoa TaxID=2685164 RepID=UPI00344806E1
MGRSPRCGHRCCHPYGQPREARQTTTAAARRCDEPPLRLFLGSYRDAIAETVHGQRLRTWGQWRDLAESAG